ncbi:MAG: WD40 repeat domain-containing protein [Planctomycetales bacterium]
MRCHPILRYFLFVGLLMVGGCQAKSSSETPLAATPDGADLKPQFDAVPTGDSIESGTAAQGANGKANSSAATPDTPRKPPVKPSPEQIARWNVPEYEPLRLLACYDGFGDPGVSSLALSPDGQQFVLGGAKLTLWNRQEPQPALDLLDQYQPGDVERPIRAVAITDDGKWLAAGDQQGKVRIWTRNDAMEVAAWQAHQGHLSQLAFSPDARLLATTGYSGEVHLWELPEGKKLKSLKMGQYELHHLVFLSNSLLASAGSEARVWDVEAGTEVAALTTKQVINPALGLSPDRRLLAFNDDESTLRLWDVQSSQPTGVILRGAGAHRISFSRDGKWIATYSNNSEIRIWEAATGRIVQVIDADGGRVSALDWFSDCDLLLVASEQGRVRIWGTPDTATAAGIEPIELPALAAPAAARQSLSSVQFLQVIDIRSFPRLPGAVPGWIDMSSCTYTVPAAQSEAEQFYRYALERAGWSEASATGGANELVFHKAGCELKVSFLPAATVGAGGEGDLQVSLSFGGNYDMRWLPKISAINAPGSLESPALVLYRSQAELTDLEVAVLKQFHEAGWTGYTRLAASSAEDPKTRTISMLQGGSQLTVFVGYLADSQTELVVQTSVSVSPKSLPLPPDSGWIEYDSSTDLQVVINTKLDLAQTVAFFDAQLATEGWLAREAGRQVKEERGWLPYIRGQQDLYLRLEALPKGGTRVIAGDAASSSWQLQKPVAENSEAPGIEVADFPLPRGANEVKYQVDEKRIDFVLADTLPPKLGQLFAAAMESLEWERDGAGIESDEYTFLTYKKAKLEIRLRARSKGKSSTAMISGDGLLWTKPLPAAPARISYETWLRRNRLPASLDRLEEFVQEMRKIPAGGKSK